MAEHPHIIIDGYNFILRQSRIDASQEHALWDAREQLVHRMVAYLGQRQILITIVFDGQDLKGITKMQRPAGISVRFSKAPQKADPLIIDMVRAAKNPRGITVVTSDNTLASFAKSFGCAVVSVEDFAQKLTAGQRETEFTKKFDVKMSDKEMQEWLRLFGEKETDEP